MVKLAEVIDEAERHGRVNLRLADLTAAMPLTSAAALRQAIIRQERRGRLAKLSRGSGHWLIVPLQYAGAKAPPLEMWLDTYLSKTLKIPYYVGTLSAAEAYGVAPYAVAVTQVMVGAPRRPLDVGLHRIEFQVRVHLERIPTRWHETRLGRFKISTPEVTAIDLIRRMSAVGGISRIGIIVNSLAEHMSESGVGQALDVTDEILPAQRLGALLKESGHNKLAAAVSAWLVSKRKRAITLSGEQLRSRRPAFDTTFKVWLDGRSGEA